MSGHLQPPEPFVTVDPTTGEVLFEHGVLGEDAVRYRLERAATAAAAWGSAPLVERTKVLRAMADLLEDELELHASHITSEMGKPILQARAEVAKCARTCRHFAGHAAEYLASEQIATEAVETYVRFDPMGVVLAIMPWNFPYFQVVRFLAPLLAAGNGALLKHAPLTMASGERIADLARRAGVPPGVVETLRIRVDAVPDVIGHPAVRGVTFTGSTAAGHRVGALAGAMGKPAVLELGGSDPVIVLADADIEEAARQAVRSRMFNSGQSCISAKRFIVSAEVVDQFTAAAMVAMDGIVVGDPTDEATDVGPLARGDLRETLSDQVARSLERGARVLREGGPVAGRGFWYEPELLVDVDSEQPVVTEETFGPVAAVATFDRVEEAIRMANRTEYGLGAAVWTQDLPVARQIAAGLDVGTVAVNGTVKSDPRVPFGGVKASGYGRELGRAGIRAFANVKAVWVEGS